MRPAKLHGHWARGFFSKSGAVSKLRNNAQPSLQKMIGCFLSMGTKRSAPHFVRRSRNFSQDGPTDKITVTTKSTAIDFRVSLIISDVGSATAAGIPTCSCDSTIARARSGSAARCTNGSQQKKVERLEGTLLHYPFIDHAEQVATNNRYSGLGAEALLAKGVKFQKSRLFFKPISKFLETYIFKRGFLDGLPGFIIAVGAAYSIFLRYVKLWELEKHGRRARPSTQLSDRISGQISGQISRDGDFSNDEKQS